MLERHSYRIEVDKYEVLKKGTIAIATTFLAGLLFDKMNMMLAFVLVLGSSALSTQNFRVRLIEKTIRLILVDWLIVLLAYVASLDPIWAIPLDLIVIFCIIFLGMTPFEPLRYKTFMMLYVFSQYTKIALEEMPKRLLMVVFSVCVVVFTNYLRERKNKSLLPESIKSAFSQLEKQLEQLSLPGQLGEGYEAIYGQMRRLAYVIYGTSHRQYFTTYLGRVQFHFYLNISYLNLMIYQLAGQVEKSYILHEEIMRLKGIMQCINDYFDRKIKRKEVIASIEDYLNEHQQAAGMMQEINEVLFSMKKNFEELEGIDQKKNYKLYKKWQRSELSKVHKQVRVHFNVQNVSFNFALRMAIILTISLFAASILGYYKFIWAIIPIMSITQPYYEDTHSRRNDRIMSNIIAALLVTILFDVVHFRWIGYVVLIAAFYLIFAYKDYYHFSFFMTIISMCMSTVDVTMNALLIYRIFYVLVGALVVTVVIKVFPYHLEDGIKDLLSHIEELNEALESESIKAAEGKGNLELVREAVLQSALLCQRLELQNKRYKSEKLKELLISHTEFCIRIGHRILREEPYHK